MSVDKEVPLEILEVADTHVVVSRGPSPKELLEMGLNGKRWLLETAEGTARGVLNHIGSSIWREAVKFPQPKDLSIPQADQQTQLRENLRLTYGGNMNGFFHQPGLRVVVSEDPQDPSVTTYRDFRIQYENVNNKIRVTSAIPDSSSFLSSIR
jgi:hypothetical protein